MTTIAIDNNTISADGQETDNEMITSLGCKKLLKTKNGVIYGYSGNTVHGNYLIDVVINGCDVIISDTEANLVTIEGEKVMCHVIQGSQLHSWDVSIPFAMGSGEKFAIAAMDSGKTSREAVKLAMKRDLYTGGKITTLKWGE